MTLYKRLLCNVQNVHAQSSIQTYDGRRYPEALILLATGSVPNVRIELAESINLMDVGYVLVNVGLSKSTMNQADVRVVAPTISMTRTCDQARTPSMLRLTKQNQMELQQR